MRAKSITAEMLEAKGACANQVDQFRQLFPNGSNVTLTDCRKAAKAGMDLGWFAHAFLSGKALAAYRQATAPALAAYRQATAPAWAAYRQATAPALAAAWKVQNAS